MVISSGSTQFLTNRSVLLAGEDAGLPLLWQPTRSGLVRVAEVLLTRRELWLHVANSLVEGLDDGIEAGARHSDADPASPTRIAALSGWEAWLHVWPAGWSTGLHRHAGPMAAAVVSGRLRELRDTGSPDAARSPDPTGSAGAGRHALVNDATEAAVTLQVYGPRTPFTARAEALLCRPARPAAPRPARPAATRPGRPAQHSLDRNAREAS